MNVCLVTNYNYAPYLRECLDSAASQTRPFDRIVIVDDGSTDASGEVIAAFCTQCPGAVAIHKENGGQLSAFQAALEHIGRQDRVFFLDADDSYPPDYLERFQEAIGSGKAEFVFVEPVRFRDGAPTLASARIGAAPPFPFPATSALTRKTLCWIGEATSCVSVAGSLLHALLPYPFEKDWVTRADDVLIYGASILGAHKLYLPGLGVNYRVHGANNFSGRELSDPERADWRLRHERLRRFYCERGGLSEHPALKNVLHEAAVIPKALRRRFGIPAPTVLFLYDLLILVPMLRILVRDAVSGRSA
ncbi:glycosyltransferase family 2 protein [Geomesophilobacter sediminis]|uniref:Glycosyltransferase family 2 protein n=1 Tax=Geomesophilobacter sediminis TaxID=2798584 RepID=A0A8J7M274_9BACT|nr:glycosyltransferase family 2 protein [Geomesophilobacter sediminis]MBJ6727317.1 glycosyltransferase family 2 protein [Geomesophilobacter sediminis]